MQSRNLKTTSSSKKKRKPGNTAAHFETQQQQQQVKQQPHQPFHDPNCNFCKILQGQLPSSTVYEDDVCQVILDIHPITKGHMLILPKQHFQSVMSVGMTQEMSMHMMRLAHLITMALTKLKKEQDPCHGTNLLMNNGSAAWQTVPHAHLHVIPRRNGDSVRFVVGIVRHLLAIMGLARPKKQQDLDQVAQQLRQVLVQEIQAKQRL